MSLPPDLDFARNTDASPERMNRVMEFIHGHILQLLALKPDVEAAIALVRDAGIERLNAGLEPVFARANLILAALEPIFTDYVEGQPLATLRTELLDRMALDAEQLDEDRLAPLDAAVAGLAASAAAAASHARFITRR